MTFTTLGVPRIGPRRELKRACEKYWKSGSAPNDRGAQEHASHLARTAWELTTTYTQNLASAGMESVPTLGRSYYDAVLDMSAYLGVLPARFNTIPDHTTTDHEPATSIHDRLPRDIDRRFATARGTSDLAPSAMTKWYDTNYHYIVPELTGDTQFDLTIDDFLADITELQSIANVRPVLVGPFTYLTLADQASDDDLDGLWEPLIDAYAEFITRLGTTGVGWVQLDEPQLTCDVTDTDINRVHSAYTKLAEAAGKADVKLLAATYFGPGDHALAALNGTGVNGIAVDLIPSQQTTTRSGTHDTTPHDDVVPSWLDAWTGDETLVAGIVNGRNVWRTNIDQSLRALKKLAERGPVVASTSCSLLHVPYRLGRNADGTDDHEGSSEPGLPVDVRNRLAFGEEKIQELAVLHRALASASTPDDEQYIAASSTALSEGLPTNDSVQRRLSSITDDDRHRVPFSDRTGPSLPVLPTTTIGSFPQTSAIRRARKDKRDGTITQDEYTARMEDEVRSTIKAQEELGLDVLVHGEPERNDMVQYFSEQLEGYCSTTNGWVQSYGSRCVRPPIVTGDVSRPSPLTTHWYRVAQDATDKPVKGMLTGPVTMLAWSFVREDQPMSVTADQVALALRDEIDDLIQAGARIIQVDEPAIRELLPLRKSDHEAYTAWATQAFRLATSSAGPDIHIHTHMCYSQFNELIDTIIDLDADVTTIESARNGMKVLTALRDAGFSLGIGPGVWDIHSPRVPSVEEITTLIRDAIDAVGVEPLWVNPDCGLKTRAWPETTASLRNMVDATRSIREQLGS
ncbi:5-methyltetrahydropteroyltriglutamate--homocysteine S-methyltransferase [Corynebacterium sp. MC-04]|uniref:5-methyltetrahydropteroyltriglutamate--homocysteine S-methyltransferase n=1 Tax=Corynebacterium parakroppenstedtii TaxID=2828363 RepID=A0ABS9HII3_9CORY|nr:MULTISPECIES: 5-methyltetrahydropteroyltriglutamate--homocysteine S-methyltransferase [Corynebacterium]MDU3197070.1 5-methyltetrahydropteroyltriglutamate--homocysteine S-methyltransferase [Corynebacterium kroppenstedtii]MBY0792443.1 5-methyltetrahydropteroyltriglutamate--homocysteine S-methyltransferase [Corynebacterium parakroppenstedtii]MBY0795801.1 5-methyltetrahydropteroyltriglutamate--homocysteine S-methyltransferase [Corynebacterium parakroppenstedtii]MCF6769394.1 5-methyltetrahydropte